MSTSVRIIPVDWITIDEDRQRKFFPEAEMGELKESIVSTKGLLCPILVRPTNKETVFRLVAGERRLRTIKSIEEPYNFGEEIVSPGHVPVVVKYFDTDMDAAEAELHENIIRLDLSWQEKAQAIFNLHELKKKLNPKHTRGMTVALVEDQNIEDKTSRTSTQYRVSDSLLVAKFLDDPEVANAKDLRTAGKIATRKIEDEAIARILALKASNQDPQRVDESNGKSDFTSDELDQLERDLTPTTSKPKPLGTLFEGDIREQLSNVPLHSINVVIADPPYGMGADGFNDGGKGTQKHEYDDSEDLALELYFYLLDNLDRVTAPNAHAYIFCDIDKFHMIRDYFEEMDGWWVRRKPLIWDKGTAGKLADGTPTGYNTVSEYCVFAMKGERKCAKVTRDIIQVQDEKFKHHAAQKPVELYKKFLEMSAVPGDYVLDPFAGSGTIFRASREMNVYPYGIELSPKSIMLCQMAQEGLASPYEDLGL